MGAKIRVVVEFEPGRYALSLEEVDRLRPTFDYEGQTYYRSRSFNHYVLYKPAISGWGAAAPNPNDARPVFDPRQR